MEILELLSKEFQAKIQNSADSIHPEEQESVFMQLMLFEELKNEFNKISKEKEKFKSQNVKLKEELDEDKKLRTSLIAQLAQIHESKSRAEARVMELEKIVQSQRSDIKVLRNEVKLLGKKPMSEFSDSLSISILADRLGFVLHLNSEQSVWLQFKKEKHSLQCSSCGGRNHVRSKCLNFIFKDFAQVSASTQIYYQRGRKSIVPENNHSVKYVVNCHVACYPPNLPEFDLAQSFLRPHVRRNQRCDTNLRAANSLNFHLEKSYLSNPENKYLDSAITQPLAGATEKKSSSYFQHSDSGSRFKHRFGVTTRRYVEKTIKENGFKNAVTIQSPRAGKKHKSIG